MKVHQITRDQIRKMEKLSPFELEGHLESLAVAAHDRGGLSMLNAGRGNPNFVAAEPREAFFRLGFFALDECRRTHEWGGMMVGMPQQPGIGVRFRSWLDAHNDESGVDLLRRTLDYGVNVLSFDEDEFVWELADAIIGDHYPMPDRMLKHNEAVTRQYLLRELGVEAAGGDGNYDLFAVEGGTAAMTYLFNSLKTNRLMSQGDKVAIMVPIFTPYLEITELAEFGFEQVHVNASSTTEDGLQTWQFPDEEIDKLRDPSVKLLYCVNPTNPPSVRIAEPTLDRIVEIVNTDNPDLMVITDDVYGTFINGFRSLMATLPHNTATVYSFSKYFGATGWRLGAVAIHTDNVFDRQISRLPEEVLAELDTRYSSLALEPRKVRFVDRLLADSRNVALAHAAGLSLPQQAQMLLFSAYCLLDTENRYKSLAQKIVADRLASLLDGMNITIPEDPNRVGYYLELDFLGWARRHFGSEFTQYLEAKYEPTDTLFRIAQKSQIVLLPGLGFDGPPWSVRVSLANLDDEDYVRIGKAMMEIAQEYVEEWQAASS